jgi:hypothetical protein
MMIGASGNGGTAWGGGIHNTGAIRFLNSLLEGNIAKMSQGGGGLIPGDPGIGRGGGIYNANSAYFVKTLFKTNVAHYGAGAFNDTDAELNITSSTLSHNAAFGPFALGGAIYNSYPAGQANLVYVTITDNYSDDQIGGVWSGGTVLIEGSIVAGNDDPSPFNIADCNWVPSVTNMTSLGHNVFGSKRCPVDESLGDFNLAELGLTIDDVLEAWMTVYPEGPFDDTKKTMLYRLKPGSLAIDQGHSADCPMKDQRHVWRPIDGDGDGSSLCDIGPYEYDPSNP